VSKPINYGFDNSSPALTVLFKGPSVERLHYHPCMGMLYSSSLEVCGPFSVSPHRAAALMLEAAISSA
jgi:hypothetical protein